MTYLARLLAPALLLGLTACSVLAGGDRNATTIYAPQVRVQADPAWPQARWQLAIAKPSAARLIDSPRINVRPTPGELEVYRGATWAQPATDMVEDIVLRAFEDAGRLDGVARIATGIRADYKLVLDIRRFESDYAGGASPAATIEIAAKLIHSVDQHVIASRTFQRAEPAGDTAIPAVASAFERALQAMTPELVGWTLQAGNAAQAGRS